MAPSVSKEKSLDACVHNNNKRLRSPRRATRCTVAEHNESHAAAAAAAESDNVIISPVERQVRSDRITREV